MSIKVSYGTDVLINETDSCTKIMKTANRCLEDDVTVEYEGTTLITKNIIANGNYSATSDNADGYSSVTVNVPSDPYEKFNQFLEGILTYFKSNASRSVWATGATLYQLSLKYFSMKYLQHWQTGGRPFTDATYLRYVLFGSSNNIGTYDFRNVGNCTIIMTSATQITLQSNQAFSNATNTFYVPDDLKSTYQAASNWVTYANNFKGFSEAPSYDATTAYNIGDVCKYNDKFYGYCKSDLTSSTGNAPTGTTDDNTYWEYVADIEV